MLGANIPALAAYFGEPVAVVEDVNVNTDDTSSRSHEDEGPPAVRACAHGHLMTHENINPSGQCRQCKKAASAKHRIKRQAQNKERQ